MKWFSLCESLLTLLCSESKRDSRTSFMRLWLEDSSFLGKEWAVAYGLFQASDEAVSVLSQFLKTS